MTKRRPKKRNLGAKKSNSRHDKVECDYCNQLYSADSVQAHYAIAHPLALQRKETQ